MPRRLALIVALLCALSAAWFVGATTTPAVPAPQQNCLVFGGISGPNPAQVGDTVGAYVSVYSDAHGICDATSVEIVASGHRYCSVTIDAQHRGCQATFQAYVGLSQVWAYFSDTSINKLLGTFTVVGTTSTPTAPRSTVRVTVTPTVHPSTSATASTSTSATKTVAANAFPTAPPGGFDGDTTTDSSSASPTVTPTQDDNAPAVPVAIIHGSGSVSLIPAALLVLALVIFAGVFGAAARYIYVHNRPPGG